MHHCQPVHGVGRLHDQRRQGFDVEQTDAFAFCECLGERVQRARPRYRRRGSPVGAVTGTAGRGWSRWAGRTTWSIFGLLMIAGRLPLTGTSTTPTISRQHSTPACDNGSNGSAWSQRARCGTARSRARPSAGLRRSRPRIPRCSSAARPRSCARPSGCGARHSCPQGRHPGCECARSGSRQNEQYARAHARPAGA